MGLAWVILILLQHLLVLLDGLGDQPHPWCIVREVNLRIVPVVLCKRHVDVHVPEVDQLLCGLPVNKVVQVLGHVQQLVLGVESILHGEERVLLLVEVVKAAEGVISTIVVQLVHVDMLLVNHHLFFLVGVHNVDECQSLMSVLELDRLKSRYLPESLQQPLFELIIVLVHWDKSVQVIIKQIVYGLAWCLLFFSEETLLEHLEYCLLLLVVSLGLDWKNNALEHPLHLGEHPREKELTRGGFYHLSASLKEILCFHLAHLDMIE